MMEFFSNLKQTPGGYDQGVMDTLATVSPQESSLDKPNGVQNQWGQSQGVCTGGEDH